MKFSNRTAASRKMQRSSSHSSSLIDAYGRHYIKHNSRQEAIFCVAQGGNGILFITDSSHRCALFGTRLTKTAEMCVQIIWKPSNNKKKLDSDTGSL
jgi:hypothetical protein